MMASKCICKCQRGTDVVIERNIKCPQHGYEPMSGHGALDMAQAFAQVVERFDDLRAAISILEKLSTNNARRADTRSAIIEAGRNAEHGRMVLAMAYQNELDEPKGDKS
jgi:hypothetical protein